MGFELNLKTYAQTINGRMAELLPPDSSPPRVLHEAMRYSCLAPGKRLRPSLTLACAIACGATVESVLDAACAIEFVHCFSLIHDDLPAIDDDDLRRGFPTCHKAFGEAVAILAGDALFALAFRTLAEGRWRPDQKVAAISSLTRALGSDGLVGGETLDVVAEGQPIDFEALQEIHRRKTGALLAASCEIGAILAGAGAPQSSRLHAYGQYVGLAFQITDDILNETSTPDQLGKAAGSDRDRGKATYPSLIGLAASRQAAREAVENGIRCLEGIAGDGFLIEIARYAIDRLS